MTLSDAGQTSGDSYCSSGQVYSVFNEQTYIKIK